MLSGGASSETTQRQSYIARDRNPRPGQIIVYVTTSRERGEELDLFVAVNAVAALASVVWAARSTGIEWRIASRRTSVVVASVLTFCCSPCVGSFSNKGFALKPTCGEYCVTQSGAPLNTSENRENRLPILSLRDRVVSSTTENKKTSVQIVFNFLL